MEMIDSKTSSCHFFLPHRYSYKKASSFHSCGGESTIEIKGDDRQTEWKCNKPLPSFKGTCKPVTLDISQFA